jgi:hypothetical protein
MIFLIHCKIFVLKCTIWCNRSQGTVVVLWINKSDDLDSQVIICVLVGGILGRLYAIDKTKQVA